MVICFIYVNAESIVLVIQYYKSIGIGIGNTFFRQYWYWYCQYFLKVWLTTMKQRVLVVKINAI